MGSMASLLLGVYVELCDEEDDSPPVELLVKCIFVRRARGPPSPRPGWNILRTCRTLLDSSWSESVKDKTRLEQGKHKPCTGALAARGRISDLWAPGVQV